jgi:hypothetical protein
MFQLLVFISLSSKGQNQYSLLTNLILSALRHKDSIAGNGEFELRLHQKRLMSGFVFHATQLHMSLRCNCLLLKIYFSTFNDEYVLSNLVLCGIETVKF